jgi:outer membrane protein OmpA-like peptidoglycan-associated protein
MLESHGLISRPGDEFEDHAARAAAGGLPGGVDAAPSPPEGEPSTRATLDAALDDLGPGDPLPDPVRTAMEPALASDFSNVRAHTDADAARVNTALGADAFTYGRDIYFGSGRAPGIDPLTAHELGHVVQQQASARQRGALGSNPSKRIQPSFTGSYPVPNGIFEIDWQTRQGKSNTPTTHIGFDGYMRFIPGVGAPNSNDIVVTQIVKLTDRSGNDVNSGTIGAPQAARGALGQPGVRTKDDALRGVEGGYFTDATHQSGATPSAAGSNVSPDYDWSPAAPGTTGVGQVQQPAVRGGGIGGRNVLESGFKRSDDLTDMHSAAMYDTPGTTDPHANLKFDFETVVRGVDTQATYGVVTWGFEIVDGVVQNEHLHALDTASATFTEALDRHMDFYVHEPMTFYFDFNKSEVSSTEAGKIDALVPYLARHPRARMSIEGFADVRGGASRHNVDLALSRAEAVKAAMLAKGVTEDRFDSLLVGTAPSTSATTNAGTGDLGGNAAVGADQDREANRWANRRVLVTFTNPPGP